MERIDSAISSLQSMYGGDESDEEDTGSTGAPTAVDNISDEEMETKSVQERQNTALRQFELTQDSSSASAEEDKKPKIVKKATRLVSYGPDVEEEESDAEGSGDEGRIVINFGDEDSGSLLTSKDASSLSQSVRNVPCDEIQLPAEPPGKCSYELQEKIAGLYEKMRREGLNLNAKIQRRKDFRNPSIYEKMIEFCGIDEKGTNFPPDIFDPHMWSKDSYYDELDKTQKKEMEKREKEKKERTKIEFVTGTKKSAGGDLQGMPDEKKRKTKWDTQPQGITGGVRPLLSASAIPNPSVITLTTTATGTKTTVIPAVGNITKKISSSSNPK